MGAMLYVALVVWCFFLMWARALATGSPMFLFLMWNLFLATIPVFASSRLSRSWWPLWLGVWLLFLPNAPYLLTDLIHLRHRPPVPLWYDLALLLSCAGTGLVFTYASLARVQAFVARRFGPVLGWLTAVGSLVLSAFGIYVGRFLRWNSWDVFANPLALLADVLPRVVNPRPVGVTVVFGGMLVLGYFAIRSLTLAALHSPHARTAEPAHGAPRRL